MEQDQNAGGAGDAASGAQGDESSGNEGGKKAVTWEDHQRALRDLHKHKEEARLSKEKLSQLESSKLKEKEDWKTLAEQHEKELGEEREKNKKLSSSFNYTQKFSAVHAAAIKAGLRPEAEADLDLLDLEDVEIEQTDSGRIRVLNPEKKVSDLKKLKPHWFKSGTDLGINAGGASGPAKEQELTTAYMLSIEKKDPAKFKQLWPEYLKQRNASKQKAKA